MRYYFLSSSHLEDDIWFRDDEDFRIGMNYVAIAALRLGIGVVVFVLMSNHVHFLLICRFREEAIQFYNLYKDLYSRHMWHKYGIHRFLRENKCDCREILPEDEALEKVIAYILMNPVAANICYNTTGYPWGCGNCFFSLTQPEGRLAGELGEKQKQRMLHVRLPVDDNLLIGKDGYILPESYVRKDLVERIFRRPKRMDFFIRMSSKARLVLEADDVTMPSFRDQSILTLALDIAFSLFRKSSLEELNENEVDRVVFEVKRRSGADVKQLARVLSMSPEKIIKILSKI